MASNDSGVDTSNDSSCTNDNSNSNSNQTSINYVLVPPTDNATNAEVLDGLRQVAQKLSVLQATMPESASTYKIPSTHLHINKMSRVSSTAKSSRHQHHHSNRNALIPYVCTVPNERKLRLAASVSNVELLVRLLDAGVNPNTSDEHQRSPLHLAASRGKFVIAFRHNETATHSKRQRFRLQRCGESAAEPWCQSESTGFFGEYTTPFGRMFGQLIQF